MVGAAAIAEAGLAMVLAAHRANCVGADLARNRPSCHVWRVHSVAGAPDAAAVSIHHQWVTPNWHRSLSPDHRGSQYAARAGVVLAIAAASDSFHLHNLRSPRVIDY